MVSNILNTTLKRSCHQRCWNRCPYDFMISNITVRPRVRTSSLHLKGWTTQYTIICWSHDHPNLSHNNSTPITLWSQQLSHNYHMTITWSHGYHMKTKWLPCDYYINVTCPSHDHHLLPEADLVMTVDSSKRTGNHAFTQTQSGLLWSSSVTWNFCKWVQVC